MSTDPNPYLAPAASSDDSHQESLIIAIAKCVLVGLGVGVMGIGLCFVVLLPVLATVRELGLLLLLVLIPVGAFYLRAATTKYFLQEPSRLRGALAFGSQYLVIGCGIGLVFKLVVGGGISDTPLVMFCGSVIGTIAGSVGGAFQGWLWARNHPLLPQEERSD